MTDKRERRRAETRRLRLLAEGQSRERAGLTQRHMAKAMRKAQTIVSDQSFREIVQAQGIDSVPELLVRQGRPRKAATGSEQLSKRYRGDRSLDFIIVWTFFFPLFANKPVVTFLEETWPGFIAEVKDAFILLVVDGPIPESLGWYQPLAAEA
jgi:hypothetical protein